MYLDRFMKDRAQLTSDLYTSGWPKVRVHRGFPGYYQNISRTVISEEWERVTLDEIRARIAEMPWRYRMLREGNHVKLIKS